MLRFQHSRRAIAIFMVFVASSALLIVSQVTRGSAKQDLPAPQSNEDAVLLDGFRHVEVASVSDALEQLTGKRMYMTHRMRPIFSTRFVGSALTVSLKKEPNHDPDALKGMLQAIDSGGPNSVYVMVVEDVNDIACMGG